MAFAKLLKNNPIEFQIGKIFTLRRYTNLMDSTNVKYNRSLHYFTIIYLRILGNNFFLYFLFFQHARPNIKTTKILVSLLSLIHKSQESRIT